MCYKLKKEMNLLRPPYHWAKNLVLWIVGRRFFFFLPSVGREQSLWRALWALEQDCMDEKLTSTAYQLNDLVQEFHPEP